MANSKVFSSNPQQLQTQMYGSNSNQAIPVQTDSNGIYLPNYLPRMEAMGPTAFL